MFKDITIDDLFTMQQDKDFSVIDVRSPSEYEEATIPGSINIPVFNDKERAEVGTLYKQESPEAAKERGLQIFSAKLPHFIKEFQELHGERAVFCWRGGMRSKTAATVVDLIGMDVFRLKGGIRSYREWVVQTLESYELKQNAYVLNGYSGTGKTVILQMLSDEGYPVLDLEGMANHRGSIFGQIGRKPNNQKRFESLLVHDLLRIEQSPYVLLEGESKRIGKVVLPEFLYKEKEQGIQLFLELPIDERVTNILDDYHPWDHHQECLDAFQIIKKRIHTPIAKEIEQNLKDGKYRSAVTLLLQYYYDPLYEHSAKQYRSDRVITIKAKDTIDAKAKIQQIVGQLIA
ncbi:tRNA 2-selenouridine(34) synthase MnmH [Aquibacillus sp. 3ASR75-11]|uniref:tRNA 2-selenouridine(34) synthase MnmH n=1 Tax=Terrihalobacillus insolitus TaxID=2950438 RepID=A0A9X4AQ46_9BACI|nr:tRNA 2-selenouridine(34) synthase MnmH [Terrihalobacillus insolitus]MDC3413279.1 tRNA 2-selenouridine(34) synthase MnmH [Terrihalobacillus insolitus]MDC3426263.1 tRNA 2-selenouridine(34) synthase MnmH [Terrihalobacillus insolitus]